VRFGVALVGDVCAGADDDGNGERGDVLAVTLPQGEEIVLPEVFVDFAEDIRH